MGKANQTVAPYPFNPIPVVGEPFERVIVDYVGPFPHTKAGNKFLLTIMFSMTCFPEAIPMCKITAPAVIKALVKFFSLFGLLKVLQTDQISKMKSWFDKHPQSQSLNPDDKVLLLLPVPGSALQA